MSFIVVHFLLFLFLRFAIVANLEYFLKVGVKMSLDLTSLVMALIFSSLSKSSQTFVE